MSNSALRIFVRVVQRRIAAGETLEEILESYPNLMEEEKEQIRKAVAE